MSWEDRVNEIDPGTNSPKLADGEYILEVFLIKENIRKGSKPGTFFIAEWTVLQSSHPAHPPGSKGGMVIRMDVTYPDTPIGEVKGFAAVLFGMDPASTDETTKARIKAEITPDVIRGIKGAHNPMAGSVVAATVYTKPGDKPFQGKYRFRPVMENGRPKVNPRPQGAPGGPGAPAPAAPPPGYGQPYPGGAPAPAAPGWAPPSLPAAPVAPAWSPAPPAAPAWTPPAPAAPPAAPVFPPAGWYADSRYPGHFHNGKTVLSEAALRTMMAAGQA